MFGQAKIAGGKLIVFNWTYCLLYSVLFHAHRIVKDFAYVHTAWSMEHLFVICEGIVWDNGVLRGVFRRKSHLKL